MNTEWFQLTPGVGDPVSSFTLSDFVIRWLDLEAASPVVETLTVADGLGLEAAGLDVDLFYGGNPYYRVTGIPFSASKRELRAVWAVSGDPAFSFTFSGERQEVGVLYNLFQATPGAYPVTFDVRDVTPGDPISDVQITVWNEDLSVPIIPLLRTTVAGQAKCGLVPGTYQVFAFKPYSSFTQTFPVEVVVTNQAVTVSLTLTQSVPALPVVPKVTVFGWVLRPDYVPVVGAEVKIRLLNTPQLVAGGGGLSKYEMIATTDEAGKFEMYPVGGASVYLTCESVGYSRKGVLPKSGSLNWKDFGIEGIGV